jgi:CHAD domain-containing protein
LTAAGAVRDCDIAAKVLSKIQTPGSAALAQQFRTGRKVKEKSLIALLRRWAARKPLSKWCNGLELGAPRPLPGNIEATARSTLSGMGRKFFKAGTKAAAPGSSGEDLHDFRLLAKKFRYTLELFSPAYPSALENQIGRIKEIQSLLGAINDYQTVRNMVADSGKHPKLEAALKKFQSQRVRKFRKLWAVEFSAPKLPKQWRMDFASVGQPPRKPVTRARRSTAISAAAKA